MKYRSDDGTEEEWIWNSRDGVTPFVITLKSGKIAQHVDWNEDWREPDYQPKSGDRIFVDLTPQRAMNLARKARKRWQAKGRALRDGMTLGNIPSTRTIAKSYLTPGAPDIIEVE